MAYRNQMNKKEVLDRYWKGETTLEEETWLKEENVHPLFQYLNASTRASSKLTIDQVVSQEVKTIPQARRFRMFSLNQWIPAVAASFLLIAAAIFFLKPEKQTQAQQFAMLETYDDPAEAYAEVKEALLLVSAQLNQTSNEVAAQISKAEPYTEIFK
jgi:hypothetical protein